jgi:predicted ferric reductase
VEGYHSRFTFDDQKPRQIGMSGRIGITPFIARLKQRAIAPEKASVDLVQCIPVAEPRVLVLLKAEVATANARLHATVENEHGCWSGERLREMLPGWKSASA